MYIIFLYKEGVNIMYLNLGLENVKEWNGSVVELLEELKPEHYATIIEEYENCYGDEKVIKSLKQCYKLKSWDLFLYYLYEDLLMFQIGDGEANCITDNYYRLWRDARQICLWGKYSIFSNNIDK
jgi:hypothetical protein